MRRLALGLAALGALTAVGAVAQERGFGREPFHRGGPGDGMAQMSPDDIAAFGDARIAALHAGLKLNPDQEKLWPPVEEAIRGLQKQRTEARQARRDRMATLSQTDGRDIPGTLRFMADRQAASADTLRKLADATAPLYSALDEPQKRRLAILSHGMGGGGMNMGRQGGWRQGMREAQGFVR